MVCIIGQSLVVLQALRLYDNQLTGSVLNIGKYNVW